MVGGVGRPEGVRREALEPTEAGSRFGRKVPGTWTRGKQVSK
jgi:hypothetical protein